MPRPKLHIVNKILEKAAYVTTTWAGSSWAFLFAFGLVAVWLVTGPIYHFSDTWQLVMNTISSIVTFLMVFLLQRSQNKESLAIEVKLNEIIASIRGASNRLLNVEDLTEDEVRELHQRYNALADRAQNENKMTAPLSIEQALDGPASGASDRTENQPQPGHPRRPAPMPR